MGYVSMEERLRMAAERLMVFDDSVPIHAEWLESQGWENGVNVSDERFLYVWRGAVYLAFFPSDSRMMAVGLNTTIKTRGQLKAFLAFFGDA